MKRPLVAALMLGVLAGAGTARAQSADVTVLCYHDVRDDVGGSPIPLRASLDARVEIAPDPGRFDADQYAISIRNLASQFDWLRAHGYHAISLQQLIDARQGRSTLPKNAVLITFDDGLRSVYTKAFPLLRAYRYPAVVAVVGAWADLPNDGSVDYGFRRFTRDDFATWDELREMQDSGLVEIASHTYDLHEGIVGNPQGNLIPAVLAHAWDAKSRQYETDEQYSARIRADLTRSSQEIQEKLGRAPRAIMWPYGSYTQVSQQIAASLGMISSFTLGLPVVFPDPGFGNQGLSGIPRLVLMGNPTVADFAYKIEHTRLRNNIRAVQVDLDYVYDPDPAQQERNLGQLLDRIQRLHPNEVWLQAYADPDGSGAPSSVYFPNRELPVRSDLFSRAAWQLRTRCDVDVYAWMPVLAWQLPDHALQSQLQIQSKPGVAFDPPVRLNPFLPRTREIVGNLYEDVSRAAPIAGVLFSDDAVLRDTDVLGPDAPAPGPARTMALIDFTDQLAGRVRRWNPEIATVRNLFAEPVLKPASEAWYAQSLPAFLAHYNTVAVMAMPDMERAGNSKRWLARLERRVNADPNGPRRTVYELQTASWRSKRPIDTRTVAAQMRELQDSGALHLAYYPDDFLHDSPKLQVLFPAFSAAEYPAAQPVTAVAKQ
ncbi:MAG TPA: poly-beta-1,6-N-acetyl-D-glucosamine N-deacetylase PgaB [Acidobacteriaceae bacterium]|nr:poly-beta-1,6-N-acetyl-D-glucosamine N-deacetylase PgaB [Acidobacteriaceae bacterium]